MANYTAADIKALREKTGAGMLDVKRALDEADGDPVKAEEILQVKGQKGVAKREGRTTSNGLVAARVEDGAGTLIEIDCETDFVAKGEKFIALADQLLAQAVAIKATDAEALLSSEIDGTGVKQVIDSANAAIGEKIEVRRVARVEAPVVVSYLHKTSPDLPAQIGVLVGGEGDPGVLRDVAMHVAAFSPTVRHRDDLDPEVLANQRRLAEATAREEGKPEGAIPRIVEGRVGGFVKDNTLLEQAHAKEPKKSVEQVLNEAGAEVTVFARFRVGA